MSQFTLSLDDKTLTQILNNHHTKHCVNFLSRNDVIVFLNSQHYNNSVVNCVLNNLTTVLNKEEIELLTNKDIRKQAYKRYLQKAGTKDDFIYACKIDGTYLQKVPSAKRSREVIELALNSGTLPLFKWIPKKYKTANNTIFKLYFEKILEANKDDIQLTKIFPSWEWDKEVFTALISTFSNDDVAKIMKRTLHGSCVSFSDFLEHPDWFEENFHKIYEKQFFKNIPTHNSMDEKNVNTWLRISEQNRIIIGKNVSAWCQKPGYEKFNKWVELEDVTEIYFSFSPKEPWIKRQYEDVFKKFETELKLLSI